MTRDRPLVQKERCRVALQDVPHGLRGKSVGSIIFSTAIPKERAALGQQNQGIGIGDDPQEVAGEGQLAPTRVMLIISSLAHGGAERQVVHLANRLPAEKYEVRVCSLSTHVPLAAELHEPRRLHILEKRSRYDVTLIQRAAGLLRKCRTEVLHAFLFDAEMVARLAGRLAGVPLIIASERNSDYRRPLIQAVCQRATRSCYDTLITNSRAGKRFTIADLGIPARRIQVIPNGVDVEHFCPTDRLRARLALGLDPAVPVVGMVASFKRQKNHAAFFRMARALLNEFPHALFVCVGEPLRNNVQGAQDYHREMMELLTDLRLADRVLFLGGRDDMTSVYNAFDVTVLTSIREGTPNVLLESMACGVPVVARDAADNRYVVRDGQVGFVVAPDNEEALAQRVRLLLSDEELRAAMGQAGREWVEKEFSLQALVQRTASVYSGWLARKRVRSSSGLRPEVTG